MTGSSTGNGVEIRRATDAELVMFDREPEIRRARALLRRFHAEVPGFDRFGLDNPGSPSIKSGPEASEEGA